MSLEGTDTVPLLFYNNGAHNLKQSKWKTGGVGKKGVKVLNVGFEKKWRGDAIDSEGAEEKGREKEEEKGERKRRERWEKKKKKKEREGERRRKAGFEGIRDATALRVPQNPTWTPPNNDSTGSLYKRSSISQKFYGSQAAVADLRNLFGCVY